MPKMNTIGGHEIRSLAHGLFGNIDRVAIREAIKNFCSSGSLTTFVFEIGEVIQTAEQMKFIAALKEFLPRDLQADFAALCRMNIRGYKDFLKGKPPETVFFNDTATTEIYTLSLHDALPICTIAGPLAHSFRNIFSTCHFDVILIITSSSPSGSPSLFSRLGDLF